MSESEFGKVCPGCGAYKTASEYYHHCRLPHGLSSRCKQCMNASAKAAKQKPDYVSKSRERWQKFKAGMTEEQKARRRESQRESQAKYRDKRLAEHRAAALERRAALREIKSEIGCQDCGEKNGEVLEFFRPDPELDKKRDCRSVPLVETFLEIAKDRIVLCRNCRTKRVLARRKHTRPAQSRPHERQARARRWLAEIKHLRGCVYCGEKEADALEFHHRPGEVKTSEVSALADLGLDVALEEAEKCDVVCANCHRRFHWFPKSMEAA